MKIMTNNKCENKNKNAIFKYSSIISCICPKKMSAIIKKI